jgi:predicted metalloprotease
MEECGAENEREKGKRNQRLKCKMQNCGGPSGGLLFLGE